MINATSVDFNKEIALFICGSKQLLTFQERFTVSKKKKNFLHSCFEVFVFHVFLAELFLVVILSFSFAVSSSHLLWLQITFWEKVIKHMSQTKNTQKMVSLRDHI